MVVILTVDRVLGNSSKERPEKDAMDDKRLRKLIGLSNVLEYGGHKRKMPKPRKNHVPTVY